MLILDFPRFKLSYCVKLPVLVLSYGKDLGIVKLFKNFFEFSCPFFKPVTSVAVRISVSLVRLIFFLKLFFLEEKHSIFHHVIIEI